MENTEKQISFLVDKYSDMIFRLAFSYMKNIYDAEDAVQDVFIKLIENDTEFENDEHEKFWIIRVTINICKNKLKQFWNKNIVELSHAYELPYNDSYGDDSVLNAVMSLPEHQRIAIHLYYYEGYRTAEIAGFLKKRESTVRSILHRARKQLKEILKEAYDFEQ